MLYEGACSRLVKHIRLGAHAKDGKSASATEDRGSVMLT